MKKIRLRIKKKNKPVNQNQIDDKKLHLKKKRKIQRIKRRFIISAVFISLITILAVLFKAPFFNIRQVICVGQERLTEKQILETAHVAEGQNIFLTDISAAKERVAKIPYVSESNARRIFPDKVKIWVRESVPAFVVEKGGIYTVLDKNTKVLELVKENKENVASLILPEVKNKKPGEIYLDSKNPQEKKLLELISILDELGMIKSLNNIDFSDISDIIILYDSRLKIKIGNTSNMEYKLKFIDKVIREKISDYEKATVDYTGDKLYVGQFETQKQEEVPENAENSEADGVEEIDDESKKENNDGQKTT